MYKKIYVEVTNNCNLNCPFCIKNNREKEHINLNNFKILLSKINKHTKYLYLHVMGETLLHPQINDLINIGSKNFNINITTNGYLINKIKDNHNIRQINISLHSFNSDYKSLSDYMNDICMVIDNLHNDTYFSLRIWINNKYNKDIISYLEKYYNKKIEMKNNFNIINNVYLSIENEFIWPSLENDYYNEDGTCYALKDHIGILVNGDVVPCCLDSNGVMKLGNIYKDDLDSIINSKRYQSMINGFKNNKKCEELCKKCNFLKR